MSMISGTELRAAMRRLPSPVTIVTSSLEGEIRGITIGSFTSLSLEPPLISLNLSVETPMLGFVERAGRFVVHFLRDDQARLSETFAVPDVPGSEQFADVLFHLDDSGLPIIEGVLARLHCSVEELHPAGDHVLVIGRVSDIEEPVPGEPLIYFNRSYRSVGEPVEVEFGTDSKAASTGTS